ncbi:MAG: hypothetical protein KGH87_09480, partial [Thaumarchaeota archaeon]|nr:hypothetical protein [Nitrososphaerota archaeon]
MNDNIPVPTPAQAHDPSGTGLENGDQVIESKSDESEAHDQTVLHVTDSYFREALSAKKTRTAKSRENQQMYLGHQDFSHKQAGQSAEFIPMVPLAVEQFSGFVKKALIDYGDWFDVDVDGELPITDNEIRSIILNQFNTMSRCEEGRNDLPVVIADGVKSAQLHSLMIFKVYGKDFKKKKFHVERGSEFKRHTLPSGADQIVEVPKYNIQRKEKSYWHLCVDAVNTEDYYPDPTGRNLYKIHRVERDLWEIEALAEAGIYNPEVVEKIKNDFTEFEKKTQEALDANQDTSVTPDFRRRAVIDECWGHLLDANGRIWKTDQVWARANEKYLIREPEDIPFWHGQDPFVVAPLIRVPFSVWHKALADHSVPLNIAYNELFSLMLDGGLASVHGIKQLRTEYMERPEDASGGIPQGMTIAVKSEMPADVKVLETVSTGTIPPDAQIMLNIVKREFDQASLMNSIQMGQLPERQVKATEVVQASQNNSSLLESIVGDLEQAMELLVWKAWNVILQDMHHIEMKYLKSAVNQQAILQFAKMTPEERFVAFQNVNFKVRGLQATISRAKDFQKVMAV